MTERRTNAELDRDVRELRRVLILLLNDMSQRGRIGPNLQGKLADILNGTDEEAPGDETGPL